MSVDAASDAYASPGSRFRHLLTNSEPVVFPLVLDPLSALFAERAGFRALYLGGATLGYVKATTEAQLSLTRIVDVALEIRAATDLPLILDGQCAWGDPMHVEHTVRMCEAAGIAGIEIEDQLMPKRAHHHIGVEHLVPMELMVEKIKVAVAARRDSGFVVIARTNACRSEGLDAAVRRAEAYRDAGADMLFVLEKTPDQVRSIGERVPGPLFYLLHAGLGSLPLPLDVLGELGFRAVVDPLTPFYTRQHAMRLSYESLARGSSDPGVAAMFREETEMIHDVLRLEHLLDIERRSVER